MDTLTTAERSERMRRVRGRNTGPERTLCGLVAKLRRRCDRNVRGLPGSPDFVFKRQRAVVFMHGCFWHRHEGCRLARIPKSRQDFWIPKLEDNRLRDGRAVARLRRSGWRAMVVWECQLSRPDRVLRRLRRFVVGTAE
ncbi:MAG: DNA mismatch endonuclease Vsr [Deltaproteobacteria bacterium]|nr:DNA mismatch endonuclease Vsr [Deltaproteobacteria bacterium]